MTTLEVRKDSPWHALPESVKEHVYDIIRAVEKHYPNPEARIVTFVRMAGGYLVGVLCEVHVALPSRRRIVLFDLNEQPLSHPRFRVRFADVRDIFMTPYGPYMYSRSLTLYANDFTNILSGIEKRMKTAFDMVSWPNFVDILMKSLLCFVVGRSGFVKHLYDEFVLIWLLKWLHVL